MFVYECSCEHVQEMCISKICVTITINTSKMFVYKKYYMSVCVYVMLL